MTPLGPHTRHVCERPELKLVYTVHTTHEHSCGRVLSYKLRLCSLKRPAHVVHAWRSHEYCAAAIQARQARTLSSRLAVATALSTVRTETACRAHERALAQCMWHWRPCSQQGATHAPAGDAHNAARTHILRAGRPSPER